MLPLTAQVPLMTRLLLTVLRAVMTVFTVSGRLEQARLLGKMTLLKWRVIGLSTTMLLVGMQLEP